MPKRKAPGNIHFIFALDESGSMSGKRWNNLIKAFKQTLKKIIDASKSGNIYASVLKFSTSCQVLYKRE